ncbi:hypothetical protein SAMN05443549_107161 [Flavobacterium fluvii]|uniref:Uncharacterized protein n=1 Tax=Flavobacterium fluvii TaxID=468056 RepID=A0A1M5N9C5_9FLAO|nr:hypothetical protein [Flavobacterium fluvii]SHG86186.1 hypothetical protein SAMN05443549_107161 [Flavobacterium fluvii]
MEKLIFAKQINDSQLTGIVDVSTNPPTIFCLCEEESIANEILKSIVKAEKWDKLNDEIGKYYENDTEDDEENEDEEFEGSLLDIGETAAIAFGYL